MAIPVELHDDGEKDRLAGGPAVDAFLEGVGNVLTDFDGRKDFIVTNG